MSAEEGEKKLNRRHNPMTETLGSQKFDHLEWTVGDAWSATKVFKNGLGMTLVAESKKETGNHSYSSYVLKEGDIKFIITAPYLSEFVHPADKKPNPTYDAARAKRFFQRHGSGVSAVGVVVDDVRAAYQSAVEKGAKSVLAPTEVKAEKGSVVFAELEVYGDDTTGNPLHLSETVLRLVQYIDFEGPWLPGYRAVEDKHPLDYGLIRMDHVVGNVYDMNKICADIKKWTGFYTFGGFTKEQIQTPWTSLNSEVLSSNNNRVLMPINETAEGKKESQIMEYLKAYNGPGVQHIAIKSSNIFRSVSTMRQNSHVGFEFIPTPKSYYEDPVIIERMANNLTKEEIEGVLANDILVDLDDEGVLLQIFTKPLFDRPTVFVEIIQRKCMGKTIEVPGCGGFGTGNFKSLFEAIERMQAARGGLL